jgi:hypothetical protein
MNSDMLERYKLIFEAHIHAAEFRATIIRGLLLVYAALAATFAWLQAQATRASFLAPLIAAFATGLFWFADRRHRAAVDGSKKVGEAIERAAQIPKDQRYFEGLNESYEYFRHSLLIDISCGVALFFLILATALLICSGGDLNVICRAKWNLII